MRTRSTALPATALLCCSLLTSCFTTALWSSDDGTTAPRASGGETPTLRPGGG